MKTQLLLRPPEEIKKWLMQTANKRGLTVNGLVIQILWDYIRQQSNQ